MALTLVGVALPDGSLVVAGTVVGMRHIVFGDGSVYHERTMGDLTVQPLVDTRPNAVKLALAVP